MDLENIKLTMRTPFYTIVNLIFNAYRNNKAFINVPVTNKSKPIIHFLYQKGLIIDIKLKFQASHVIYQISFNYINGSLPLYKHLKFVSTPKKRIYVSFKNINIYLKKYNSCLVLISTSMGFLSLIDCYKYKKGGELICIIS